VELDFVPTAIARKYDPQRPCLIDRRRTRRRRRQEVMAQPGRFSTIVDRQSHLTIAIAFGSLVATLSLGMGSENLAWTWPVASRWSTNRPPRLDRRHAEVVTILTTASTASACRGHGEISRARTWVVACPGVTDARRILQLSVRRAVALFRRCLSEATEPI